jgi:hypothetical protein
VLTKLEIAENNLSDQVCPPFLFIYLTFFSQGINYIGRLLKGQIKLVKTVPIDRRLNANFLGSIDIGNPQNISEKVLNDIRTVPLHLPTAQQSNKATSTQESSHIVLVKLQSEGFTLTKNHRFPSPLSLFPLINAS